MPDTASPRPANCCAAGRDMTTNWLSYWNMPVLKMPVTSYCQRRGTAIPERRIHLRWLGRNQRDHVAHLHPEAGRRAVRRESRRHPPRRWSSGNEVAADDLLRERGDRHRAGVGLEPKDVHRLRIVAPRRKDATGEMTSGAAATTSGSLRMISRAFFQLSMRRPEP